jgi:uncharacterized protein YceH (UPF0502 family)
MTHRLKGIGLPNVVLLDGFRVEDHGEQSSYFYDDLDGLYVAVARAIALSPSELTAAELRFLRKRLGLTQDELGARVEKKGQTVAKWEKGELSVPRADALVFKMHWLGANSPKDLVGFALRSARSSDRADPMDYVFSRTSGRWSQDVASGQAAAAKRAVADAKGVIERAVSTSRQFRVPTNVHVVTAIDAGSRPFYSANRATT